MDWHRLLMREKRAVNKEDQNLTDKQALTIAAQRLGYVPHGYAMPVQEGKGGWEMGPRLAAMMQRQIDEG